MLKNIKKKLNKKLNNLGSSIVMVVVALGFIGIIVGALLSAASYAYKLKLQQMNAKDNFYYVEQAMQEIYVGVGTHTISEMKEAYTYTIENMVHYNTSEDVYETISNEKANEKFRDRYMYLLKSESDLFASGSDLLADKLEDLISNDSVKLDKGKLSLEKKDDEIIIKDVTLTRTQDYDKNMGNGTFTQTLTSDIVISQPDFEINFTNLTANYSVIYDFAVVADMGVEVNQGEGNDLAIVGNVYGGSDYYNKLYNQSLYEEEEQFKVSASVNKDNAGTITGSGIHSTGGLVEKEVKNKDKDKDGKEVGLPIGTFLSGTYTVANDVTDDDKTNEDSEENSEEAQKKLKENERSYPVMTTVSNKGNAEHPLINNEYSRLKDANDPSVKEIDTPTEVAEQFGFNGENSRSRYSGIYIDNTNVSIMADTIIVPGTLAVMNDSDLAIYNKTGSEELPELWADDVVLGGKSTEDPATTKTILVNDEEVKIPGYFASSAKLRVNAFIKDDTEMNAPGSKLALNGSYYGYGNSTLRDDRRFIKVVDKEKFVFPEYNEDGTVKLDERNHVVFDENSNRGHYNSSAIVINAPGTNLDLINTKELYVAGRAYIEFSKYNTTNTTYADEAQTIPSYDNEYLYHPTYGYVDETGKWISGHTKEGYVDDYRTGESIAYKPSQLMYNVSTLGKLVAYPDTTNPVFYGVEMPLAMKYNFESNEEILSDLGNLTASKDDDMGMTTFFPASVFNNLIPAKEYTVNVGGLEKTRTYLYIDFEGAYNRMIDLAKTNTVTPKQRQDIARVLGPQDNRISLDEYMQKFAVFYGKVLNMWQMADAIPDDLTDNATNHALIVKKQTIEADPYYKVEGFTDIAQYDDFNMGDVDIYMDGLNNPSGVPLTDVYTSGAVSVKKTDSNNPTKYTFSITSQDNDAVLADLLSDYSYDENVENVLTQTEIPDGLIGLITSTYNMALDLSMEYNYVKWNLTHIEDAKEKQFVSDIVEAYGDSIITPINKYMLFDNFANKPSGVTKVENTIINPENDAVQYRIWASDDDVKLDKDKDGSDLGDVTGIIITKGDVIFGEGVTSFTGMVVSGGKVYFNGKMDAIAASPQVCREIIKQVETLKDMEDTENATNTLLYHQCDYFYKLFRVSLDRTGNGSDGQAGKDGYDIDTISYTDVVDMSNFTKTVGGVDDETTEEAP